MQRTVAVYLKSEDGEDQLSETDSACRLRPTVAADVIRARDFIRTLPKRRMNVVDRVRVGYLMQVSSLQMP